MQVCRVVDRNTLSQGALRGRPPNSPALYVSAVAGQRELKWTLHEIVSRPALRRDVMLHSDVMADHPGALPWRYVTSAHAEPMLYGYRGQMLDWDFIGTHRRFFFLLRATAVPAGTAEARITYENSVFPSVCPSVCHDPVVYQAHVR